MDVKNKKLPKSGGAGSGGKAHSKIKDYADNVQKDKESKLKEPNQQLKGPGKGYKKSKAISYKLGDKPVGDPGYKGKFGSVGKYEGVSKKRVKKLADSVIRQEKLDLQRQRRAIRRQSEHDRKQAKTDYKRGKQDLEAIYSMVGNQMNALEADRASSQQIQQDKLAASRAYLSNQLASTYQNAADQSLAEGNRLGISQGINNSQTISDRANAENMANLMSFVTDNSLNATNNSANNLGSLVRGMTGASHYGAIGRNLNDYNDSMAEIRNNKYDELNKVNEAIREAKGSRKDVYFELMQQLQQTGWSQYLDLQNLKLQRKQLRKKK